MKIKKLTIHGFKSFVDKVTFNFPQGTSAVIGPNGCGKSNIVDAIRWVLGEQNARHLRGKLMEDVIFNGSESRKQLGMAEVVLTFSNEDGQAPARFANFTEIEISRRLYRSGESEYYINKVQSRLRDIVDLFTDTGIGTRAYSIIEQGQVGWLINARPEERRVIFEEAAGINKFKHKKEAALRRLEATRENLTRVNDIISEVKRQLNSLNRQAKKAERYKVLREELRSIDLLLSSFEFRKLAGELGSSARRLESVRDEELSLSAGVNEKEGRLDGIKVEYLNAENEYKGVRERIFELERLIQNEERATAISKMRIEELERAGERLLKEIAELEGGREASASEIERLTASLSGLDSLITDESGKLDENSGALEEIISELKGKEEALKAEKAESLKVSSRLSDIRHLIQTILKDEEILRIKEARAVSEKEEAVKALASKEGPFRALKEALAGTGSKREAADGELRETRRTLETLENERALKTAGLKTLKDGYARVSARLSTLEEMERNYESLKGGARSIMLKESKSGIHGLIADVIEANAGYERAVEAVLGDRLQYVIVESHKEGVEAIDYLKGHSGGRGSFVPLRDLRASSPVPVQAGYYQGAKELISELKVRDGYAGIINCLLGDTLIVDSLEAGIEVWRQNGIYKTLVTLEGEIIDPQGVITGGASNGAEAGILQKRGEIKRFRAEAGELEKRLSGEEEALLGIEENLQGAKAHNDELKDRLHSIEIERVDIEGQIRKHEEEIARLERTRASSEADIADALKRFEGISERKITLSMEREALDAALSEREGKVSEITCGISLLAEKKEKLSHIVTELRVSLAQARERFESVKRQISDKERMIAETAKRLGEKKEEIGRGKAESLEKQNEIDALRARLDGLLADIDGVKKEEIAKTEALAGINERIRETEAELKELKSRVSEIQELKGELSIDIREMELNIANLRERITERYGADISAFTPSDDDAALDLVELESKKEELRQKISDLGEVSLSALEEYAELERRHQFLLDQQADLSKSVEALHTAISRINRTTREKFKNAFEEINSRFQETFPRFFNGGKAELRLTDDGDLLEAGVEIVAQPPGKRLQNITLLSGGEKALTATSLIFAIFLIKPSPFCLLDEVDAPLDEANIDRFNMFVRDMSRISQFVLITHNKKTMEMSDALYGITMEEPGVSKIISVRF